VRLIDFGLRITAKSDNLFILCPELAVLHPAATPVNVPAVPGVPDTEEMRAALERKVLRADTSLLFFRQGSAHFGRFFISGQELDLSCLVGTSSSQGAETEPAVPAADDVKEDDGSLPVGENRAVVLNFVEEVDRVWVTSLQAARSRDVLSVQLDDMAKEGVSHLAYVIFFSEIYSDGGGGGGQGHLFKRKTLFIHHYLLFSTEIKR
jgi:hypothetical protein